MGSMQGEHDDTDAEEVHAIVAAQQNPVAFADLYMRYQTRIARYVQTQVVHPQDAEDITQQIFLQALKALPRYRPRGIPFIAWLFHIAHNVIVDARRHQRMMLSWESLPEAMTITHNDPAMVAEQEETVQHLRRLLRRLSPTKQELLALRFAAQLTSPQIAEVVGKSPSAVKKQLTRILRELQEQYDEA